ncbi:MAG: hypothetical protein J6Z17_03665, partial [Treponema sp.]|nr:hypothetical protein [Treponema sp.]
MKKLIKFLLIAIPVLFLAGCTTSADDEPAQKPSGENPGQNPGQDPNPGPEQTFKGKTVNLIYAYDLESIDDDDAEMFTHVCIAFLQHEADSTELMYDDDTDLSSLKESIKSFKKKHPNVKVLISYGGGDTGSENAS